MKARMWVLVVVSAVAMLVVDPGVDRANSATAPARCDTDHPASAFVSDGTSPKKADTVVVCETTTGYGAAETQIEVNREGEVIVVPAMTAQPGYGWVDPDAVGMDPDSIPGEWRQEQLANGTGSAYSRDGGTSWQFLKMAGRKYQSGDHGLYIDPLTSRAYYSSIYGTLSTNGVPYGPLATLPAQQNTIASGKHSAAGYTEWNGPNLSGTLAENAHFTSAPAPAGQKQAATGENVAYYCANGPDEPLTRLCLRTFDGGAAWEFASLFSPSCPQAMGIGGAGPYPQGDPTDGSLWAACGTNLVHSTDEASTWNVERTLPQAVAGNGLRLDLQGNMYYLSISGRDHLLRVSSDHGVTWRGPFNMTPPALRSGTRSFFGGFSMPLTVGYRAGDVALGYLLGGRAGGGYDAIMVASHNALDVQPVLYSAMVNPPNRAMFTGSTALGSGNDYVDTAIGPDGTAYAAFFSDCEKDAAGQFTDQSCRDTNGKTYTNFAQFVRPAQETTVGTLRWSVGSTVAATKRNATAAENLPATGGQRTAIVGAALLVAALLLRRSSRARYQA